MTLYYWHSTGCHHLMLAIKLHSLKSKNPSVLSFCLCHKVPITTSSKSSNCYCCFSNFVAAKEGFQIFKVKLKVKPIRELTVNELLWVRYIFFFLENAKFSKIKNLTFPVPIIACTARGCCSQPTFAHSHRQFSLSKTKHFQSFIFIQSFTFLPFFNVPSYLLHVPLSFHNILYWQFENEFPRYSNNMFPTISFLYLIDR